MRWLKRCAFVLPVVLAVGACADSTGNGDTGQARIFMSQGSISAAAIEGAAMDYVASSMNDLAVSQIDSMFVRVTAVSALRADGDTAESSSGWVTVQLADSGGKRINLLKLPASGQDSISLARGDLEAGTYKNIRLQFDSASAMIVLKEDLRVGGFNFSKGTVYPLRIPSGIIKIPTASFKIGADSLSSLNLVFNAESSVANVTATGSGRVQMAPVIHTR